MISKENKELLLDKMLDYHRSQGNIVSETELYEYYDEFLDDEYSVNIFGHDYEGSRVLKEVDPIAYGVHFNGYTDDEWDELREGYSHETEYYNKYIDLWEKFLDEECEECSRCGLWQHNDDINYDSDGDVICEHCKEVYTDVGIDNSEKLYIDFVQWLIKIAKSEQALKDEFDSLLIANKIHKLSDEEYQENFIDYVMSNNMTIDSYLKNFDMDIIDISNDERVESLLKERDIDLVALYINAYEDHWKEFITNQCRRCNNCLGYGYIPNGYNNDDLFICKHCRNTL